MSHYFYNQNNAGAQNRN